MVEVSALTHSHWVGAGRNTHTRAHKSTPQTGLQLHCEKASASAAEHCQLCRWRSAVHGSTVRSTSQRDAAQMQGLHRCKYTASKSTLTRTYSHKTPLCQAERLMRLRTGARQYRMCQIEGSAKVRCLLVTEAVVGGSYMGGTRASLVQPPCCRFCSGVIIHGTFHACVAEYCW